MDARCRYRSNMFETLSSLDLALADLAVANDAWRDRAIARQTELTKPPGSLGRLEEIAIFLAGWGHVPEPLADRIHVVIFAGNHGVTTHGVSPFPADVTAQMVSNFNAGGAAINTLTSSLELALEVVPLRLDEPTGDITVEPALTEADLLEALNAGARAVPPDIDVLVLGEMGIGNTTIAATLAARALGGTGTDWAGPGTGLDQAGVAKKAEVIERALACHAGAPKTAVETLARVGGRECAAIAGAVLAARSARVPVLLDGYVVCASIAPLFAQNPDVIDHCLAGHVSAEPAHRRLLEAMSLTPILDLEMRLGEGTGGALASSVVRAACATHNGMATFAEAKVAGQVADKLAARQ